VHLVLHDGARRQVEHALERVPDARHRLRVVRRPVPQRQDVLLKADGNDGAADLLPDHELFPQHGEDEVLPAARREALLQSHDPLATARVGRVLPHRSDSLLEEVIVTVAGQLARPLHVTVEHPELLHGGKDADPLEVLIVRLDRRLLPRCST